MQPTWQHTASQGLGRCLAPSQAHELGGRRPVLPCPCEHCKVAWGPPLSAPLRSDACRGQGLPLLSRNGPCTWVSLGGVMPESIQMSKSGYILMQLQALHRAGIVFNTVPTAQLAWHGVRGTLARMMRCAAVPLHAEPNAPPCAAALQAGHHFPAASAAGASQQNDILPTCSTHVLLWKRTNVCTTLPSTINASAAPPPSQVLPQFGRRRHSTVDVQSRPRRASA